MEARPLGHGAGMAWYSLDFENLSKIFQKNLKFYLVEKSVKISTKSI